MAYLDINEGIEKESQGTSKGSTQEMSKEERQDYKMVMKLLSKGKDARKPFDKNWKTYWEFYKGKQWQVKRPSYKASPNINIIRQAVQTVLPIMTDASPGFDVSPQEPSDYKFADILSKAVKIWWSRSGMQHTIVDVIFDSLVYDAGIMKVVWDEEAEEGLGDIRCFAIDSKNIYIPDDAEDFDTKCSWVIQRLFMTVGELKRKFPDKAQYITCSFGDRKEDDTDPESYSGDVLLVSPIDRKSPLDDMTNPEGQSNDDAQVEVLECWLDDYSMEEYMLENEEGVKEKAYKKKYPTGKVVTIIPSKQLLLQVKPNPYKDGKKPFVRFIDTLIPRQFWGEGEVEPLIEVQKLINKNMAVLLDWMNMMTNPVWILDSESGVDPRRLTNQVGAIITKNKGSEVRREQAPAMPPQMFELYNLFRQLADSQSGVHDVTQGRKPSGVTAAEAINDLQEAAQTRIRLKERNLNTSMTQLGYLVISRMMQYYNAPRMLKITGESEYPEFLEFFVEESENGYKYTYRDHSIDEQTGTYVPSQWMSNEQSSKGTFDIEVQSGTSMPFMKSKRGQLAQQLFDKDVIDAENLLDVLEWPNKDEVLRRMEERKQEEAQAAPPPGAPPPGAPPPGMVGM